MKKILLIIVMMLPMMIIAETVVPPGPVSGYWKASYSPYMVSGDIYIEDGATLEIGPGVEIHFKGWYQLEVFGSLIAQGNDGHEIIFVNSEGTSIWYGIRFMETTATSILDHCIVQGATSHFEDTISPENCGGGILCYNSPDASISIMNSLIQDNNANYGGGIMCWNSNLHIENCEIMNNSARYGGGIVLYENSDATIKNTKVFNNHATFDGGGISSVNSTNFIVNCNQIAFNRAENGAGLHLVNSGGDFCSNTIAMNTAAQDGGGIYFGSGSSPSLTNCLVYSNTDGTNNGGHQVFLGQLNCDPGFIHCNIYLGETGFEGPGAGSNYSGAYISCVDGDPLFRDAEAGDFNITWENYPYDDQTKSACIDKGCPLQGPDPDQSCCDIGVFSYYQVLQVPTNLYGEVLSPLTFNASWSSSYGALGYYLDVSYHRDFSEFIMEGQRVIGTEYMVQIPYPATWVFFRLRSYNTGLTSEYSDEHVLLWVSLDEPEDDVVEIFSSAAGIHINTSRAVNTSGEIRLYNLSGQILGHYSMKPGNNTIDPGLANQVILVNVILDGDVYQQKLLLH